MKKWLKRYGILFFISLHGYFLIVMHYFFQKDVSYAAVIAIAIAVAPWILTIIRRLELPQGWAVEFRVEEELREIQERAIKSGLVKENQKTGASYSFQTVLDTDHRLALAGLRIEIESRLRKIADSYGINTNHKGVGHLIRDLSNKGSITEEQIAVIRDLLGLLNRAIHADDIDLTSAQWAANEGAALLNGLDRLAASRADRRAETKKTVRRPTRPG
ncbi:MAG: hypothetical protein F9K24_02125 [Leptonema illini]|jgi:hypothetical protein|uniref:DUF4145 domain-containing protein n=1 Tax=Leptonema illini TaxID=183 RepID=A0A833H423_9LEPT|nr:MAG: hypothetical protein F9K24_02125 [Leptonema illini]PKL30275.1 MAG: hypothetical protein CVV45_18360 [Spirochaetae bacterium HGW-Spirochaetae-10]